MGRIEVGSLEDSRFAMHLFITHSGFRCDLTVMRLVNF